MFLKKKRNELFPIFFRIKKYGISWHLVGRCCDIDYYIPSFLLLIIFAFNKEYRWSCSKCGHYHEIEMVYHTVPTINKELRGINNKIDNNKEEVFKNG